MIGFRKAVAASITSAAIFISGLALLPAPGAAVTLLADDEARRAIIDLRARVEAMDTRIVDLEGRLQAATQGQLQILNENERLRAELARLRGQIEEAHQTANTGKSQQKDLFLDLDRRLSQQKDLYADIDQRIKQIEPVSLTIDGMTVRVGQGEKARFEELRELLRDGEFKKTVTLADAFQQAYPASQLLANILLIKGSALYADKNYKAAIAARQEFIDRYPNHPSRPQAILNLAASQAESGNPNTARGILDNLIKNYPNSPAAAEARERLKTLRPSAPPAKVAPAKAASSK